MDLKLYNRPTVPSFQPQQPLQQQTPPQRRRDFSNTSTAPMSSAFSFSYDNSNDFGSWAPSNGNINNMMNLNNGPQFPRHMASPPPPPLMNPQFHHQQFAPPPPPPPHFSSPGPVGGFQQQQFPNGVLSPLHSPGLGPVIPHMHNSNGNSFAPPPPSYHNIPPPSGPLGTRNQNQHQIPPPPNFAMSFPNSSMNGVMHIGSRENGPGHHLGPYITPPVSAPSSPSPPPPHMINGSVPTQLPTLSQFTSLQSSIPRTVSRPTNKPPTPPLPKSNLAASTVLRNEPTPVSTNNDQSITSNTPKPKLNPNASSFLPVVKSPAIVSSTPPPKRAVTPPTKPRTHPFNPLSAHFTPSTCSTPSKEDQSERREKFNPNAPAFVPVSDSPPLPAKSGPPLNAPTGPASLVPRTNPPPSIPPYPKLPLSPPTGPKADRHKMPPRPNIGLGIGMGAANEIQERGLPPTTPLGPKAMNTPTGPRAERERPLSRALSSREGFHARSYSGSEGYNPREKFTKEPPLVPIVALTRIPGIDKPVPTGPAAMLADLPPAAKIPDVPIAPAAMLAKMKEAENGSQNGSDDGSRGRPGFLARSASQIYPLRRYSSRVSRGGSRVGDNNSRNGSKSRDGSATPGPIITEIEITCHEITEPLTTEILTEEPESMLEEVALAKEAEQVTFDEKAEVGVAAPITIVQDDVKEDDEPVNTTVEVLEKEQAPVVELSREEEEEEVLPKAELVASVIDKTEIEVEPETMVITPAPVEQPVFTTILDEKVEDAKVEEVIAVEVAPVSLPSIQIEADDCSRTQVDLEKDLDTNVDSLRPAVTPSPRLSEISIKKREEEGDEIDKEIIAVVQEEAATEETEKKKDIESVEVKSIAKPIRADPASILNQRKKTKNLKRRARRAQDKATTASSESPAVTPAPAVEPVVPVEIASEEEVQAPAKKHANRSAVVINAILQAGPNNRPVAVKKDTENDVGFIAESPVPIEHNVIEVEEVVPIKLDEEQPILDKSLSKEDAEKEATKINLEEHEKDHDGGVKLDLGIVDDLPPLPEGDVMDIEPSKITEIYSDSESVKEEQDDDEVSTPAEAIEVKPLNIVKNRDSVKVVEEEAATPEPIMPEPVLEPEVVEPTVIQKESAVEEEKEEEEPVTVVAEPIVIQKEVEVAVEEDEPVTVAAEPFDVAEESPVVELLEQLLVPAVQPTVELTTEIIKESAVLEPRYTGEVAISINSIIEALASCKDINSLSGTLETFSRVSKPGTQEERLFKELHHYAAIADPVKVKDNSDKMSTRSKTSMRSVRSFFKRRAEAYPELLSSTTSRIKAILPPFLSMAAAPAINTIPTSGTITPSEQKTPIVTAAPIKSQRPRLLPKMTMSLLHRSFSNRRA